MGFYWGQKREKMLVVVSAVSQHLFVLFDLLATELPNKT
jgi:hypothetical protein